MDPNQIERTLHDLWKEYADGARQGAPMGARARLANLVTWCRTAEESARASATVAALSVSRPVRSIIITASDEDGEARSAASIQCSLAGVRPVCYEEVSLHTPGEAACALPALIEPLTIPDLPTFLWFAGDPPLGRESALRLLPFVERVVTDSHAFSDPLERFRQVHGLMQENRGRVVFTEMTWTRLGVWREAVGKLFDPEDSRAFLPGIREVTITSVRGDGTISDRALLMAGWLASRLRWRPVRLERGAGPEALFESSEGLVRVTFLEGEATSRGHLLAVELSAGEVAFRVSRCENDPSGAIRSATVCTGEEAPGPAYRPHHFSESDLLVSALEIRSPFVDWEEAVAAIAALGG